MILCDFDQLPLVTGTSTPEANMRMQQEQSPLAEAMDNVSTKKITTTTSQQPESEEWETF